MKIYVTKCIVRGSLFQQNNFITNSTPAFLFKYNNHNNNGRYFRINNNTVNYNTKNWLIKKVYWDALSSKSYELVNISGKRTDFKGEVFSHCYNDWGVLTQTQINRHTFVQIKIHKQVKWWLDYRLKIRIYKENWKPRSLRSI